MPTRLVCSADGAFQHTCQALITKMPITQNYAASSRIRTFRHLICRMSPNGLPIVQYFFTIGQEQWRAYVSNC